MSTSTARKVSPCVMAVKTHGPSSSDRVVEAIKHGILTGRFVPGQRLIEADVTRTLGISRGPVREAMKRLASEGLVALQPHRGAYIRALTRGEIVDLIEVIEVLIGLAVRLAAQRIDRPGNRATLDRAFRRLSAQGPDADRTAQSVERTGFYDTIVAIAGNRELTHMNPVVPTVILRIQIHGYLNAQERAAQFAAYPELYEAIANGDARRADAVLKRHIRLSLKQILRLPDEAFATFPSR